MRFSSLFHFNASQRPAATVEQGADLKQALDSSPAPLSVTTRELPDDLDQRVRLIGEWQLGEGD